MDLGRWKWSTGGIVFLISLSDVTHGVESEGDCTRSGVSTVSNPHPVDMCAVPEGSWW